MLGGTQREGSPVLSLESFLPWGHEAAGGDSEESHGQLTETEIANDTRKFFYFTPVGNSFGFNPLFLQLSNLVCSKLDNCFMTFKKKM